ncbi:MAG: hypothetical protein LBG70_02660 [Bifidobacteriaceae bacterium]|nr:hypothetical protein [Bifidobacteriaceae bacterium]
MACKDIDRLGTHIAWSYLTVSNTSDKYQLYLDTIKLFEPHNLTVWQGYLTPEADGWLMSMPVGQELPVDTSETEIVSRAAAEGWLNRREFGTAAAVLQPGEKIQLVIEISQEGDQLGFARGFDIGYHTNNGDYAIAKDRGTILAIGTDQQTCDSFDTDTLPPVKL